MPEGYFDVANNSQGLSTRCYWRTDDNPNGNNSVVWLVLEARRSSSNTAGPGSWVFTIDGTNFTVNATVNVGTAWVTIGTVSKTVGHGPDGRSVITLGMVSGGVPGTSWTNTVGTSPATLADYSRPPGTMAAPTVSGITPTTALISWTAPASPMPITTYDLHVCQSPEHSAASCTIHYGWTNSTALSKTVTGMVPGKTYQVAVRAQSSEGFGGWSPWVAFTTLAGLFLSDGSSWFNADVQVSDGVAWHPASIAISNGTEWKAPA